MKWGSFQFCYTIQKQEYRPPKLIRQQNAAHYAVINIARALDGSSVLRMSSNPRGLLNKFVWTCNRNGSGSYIIQSSTLWSKLKKKMDEKKIKVWNYRDDHIKRTDPRWRRLWLWAGNMQLLLQLEQLHDRYVKQADENNITFPSKNYDRPKTKGECGKF